MPEAIIVAGPNGAGKSTFIANYLPSAFRQNYIRLDADEIEGNLDAATTGKEQRSYLAGRILLDRLDGVVEARGNFILETTLSLRGYALKIPNWRICGYRVTLIYLRLTSVEESLERVHRRVASGGHDIAEAVIRRRFQKSLDNLETLYKPIVNQWYMYVWETRERTFKFHSASEIE